MNCSQKVCRTCLKVLSDACEYFNLNSSGVSTEPTAMLRDKIRDCVPELNLNISQSAVVCRKCATLVDSAYKFKTICLRSEEIINKYPTDVNNFDIDLAKIVEYHERSCYGVPNGIQISSEIVSYDVCLFDGMSETETNENSDWSEDSNIVDLGELSFDYSNTTNLESTISENNKYKQKIENKQSISPQIFEKSNTPIIKNENNRVSEVINVDSDTLGLKLEDDRLLPVSIKIEDNFGLPADDLIPLTTTKDNFPLKNDTNINNSKRHKEEYSLVVSKIRITAKNNTEQDSALLNLEITNSTERYNSENNANLIQAQQKSTNFNCFERITKKNGLSDNKTDNTITKELDKNYECNSINKQTKSQKKMNDTLQNTNADKKDMYTCKVCNYNASRSSALALHSRVHVKPKYVCINCDYTSNSKNRLQNHMKRVHVAIEIYKCDLCRFVTSVKSIMQRHTNTHTKPYACSLCNYKTSAQHFLRNHVKKHF